MKNKSSEGKGIKNKTIGGNKVSYYNPTPDEIGIRLLTQEEIDRQDIFLCASEKERISIRNLLKLLRSINQRHFDLVIKEITLRTKNH